MERQFRISDRIEILTGRLAGYEGVILEVPELWNLFTFQIAVDGYPLRGFTKDQFQLSPFPPNQNLSIVLDPIEASVLPFRQKVRV